MCRYLSKALGGNIQIDATVYFAIGSLFLLLRIGVYILASRSPLLTQKLNKSNNTHRCHVTDNTDLTTLPLKQSITIQIWGVLKKIYPMALSMACLYTVTIGLMPSIISGIESVDRDNGSPITNKYFEGM